MYFVHETDFFPPVCTFPACLRGIRLNRKCFVVSEQSKSHGEADEDCVAQGGTLAIPQDMAENDALRDYAKCSSPECQDFWLGITDSQKEGCFVDVNGRHVTFFNWAPGQGGRHGGRHRGHHRGQNDDCVLLSTKAQGKWRDECCDRQNKYFCEFLISQCASRLP